MEDSPIHHEFLTDVIQDLGFTICGSSFTKEDAKKKLKILKPDIVILDIKIEDDLYAGVEVGEIISKQYPDIPIIYLTAHGENAKIIKRAQDTNQVYFLDKPVLKQVVQRTILLVLGRFGMDKDGEIDSKIIHYTRGSNSFLLYHNKDYYVKHLDDVLYIKGDREYSTIYFLKNEVKTEYLLSINLAIIEKSFSKCPMLKRISKPMIVNVNRIEKFISNGASLKIGDEIFKISKIYVRDYRTLAI